MEQIPPPPPQTPQQWGQQPYGVPGAAPARPGSVTAASVLLIILGVIPCIFAVLALAYGVVKLIAGIQVLKPKNGWRVTGIVFASIGAAFWVIALIGSISGNNNNNQFDTTNSGPNAGGIVLSLVLLAANAITIVLLARAGAFFRGPAYRSGPAPLASPPGGGAFSG
jgi:hypothetical protein